MFKKKRYRKQTIGKLQLFLQKESYKGYKNFLKNKNISTTIKSIPLLKLDKYIHFNNVTKKKIYNTDYEIC